MPDAFVTWVDAGERRALAAAPQVSSLTCKVSLENQPDEINLEELTKMANKTSKRLHDIRAKQDGQYKTLASLNSGACKNKH
jgi:hypothetical protein